VAFGVEDYDKSMEFFRAKGKNIFQGGTWSGLTYTYLDSRKDLGTIAEIYKLVPDFKWPEPVEVYPPK
jgi:hypothetical protein